MSDESAAGPEAPGPIDRELEIELIESEIALCEAKRQLADTKARSYPFFAICALIVLVSIIVGGAALG